MSQFYVWDENNVHLQSSTDFLNDDQRKNGFASGTAASSSIMNTALRQATLITAALMEMLTIYNNNSSLTVQSSINDVKQSILNGFKNFDASNMKVEFDSGWSKTPLVSNNSLSTLIGKINGWLTDLKALAFRDIVSNTDIANGAITTAKLDNSSVTTAKIAAQNITTALIANLAVTSGKIADGAVTTQKLANNSVTNSKLGDSTVTSAKIVDKAITEDKLANGSVTTAKLGLGSVSSANLASDTICPKARADIRGNDIESTYAKLYASTLTGASTVTCSIGTVFISILSHNVNNVAANQRVYPYRVGESMYCTDSIDSFPDNANTTYDGVWRTMSRIRLYISSQEYIIWLIQRVA